MLLLCCPASGPFLTEILLHVSPPHLYLWNPIYTSVPPWNDNSSCIVWCGLFLLCVITTLTFGPRFLKSQVWKVLTQAICWGIAQKRDLWWSGGQENGSRKGGRQNKTKQNQTKPNKTKQNKGFMNSSKCRMVAARGGDGGVWGKWGDIDRGRWISSCKMRRWWGS